MEGSAGHEDLHGGAGRGRGRAGPEWGQTWPDLHTGLHRLRGGRRGLGGSGSLERRGVGIS